MPIIGCLAVPGLMLPSRWYLSIISLFVSSSLLPLSSTSPLFLVIYFYALWIFIAGYIRHLLIHPIIPILSYDLILLLVKLLISMPIIFSDIIYNLHFSGPLLVLTVIFWIVSKQYREHLWNQRNASWLCCVGERGLMLPISYVWGLCNL